MDLRNSLNGELFFHAVVSPTSPKPQCLSLLCCVWATGGAAYTEQVNVRVVDHVGRSPTFFFVNYLGHTFDSWVRTNATEALASVGARTTQAEGSFGGVNSPARMHASAREEERREVRCVQRSFLFFLFSGDRTLPCHVDRASSSRLGTYLATNLNVQVLIHSCSALK